MLIVYTAIVNGFDKLYPPLKTHENVRYVCFTDTPCDSSYEAHAPQVKYLDARKTSRWHKINSHLLFPEAEYTIWHDGNQQLICDPWELINEHLNMSSGVGNDDRYVGIGAVLNSKVNWSTPLDLGVYPHPARRCVYDEIKACADYGKEKREVTERIAERYKEMGIPSPSHCMAETSILLRRNNDRMARFNEDWWAILEDNESLRDQIAFPVACRKHNLTFSAVNGSQVGSKYFAHHSHGSTDLVGV